MCFSEWLKTIHNTEKEAQVGATARDAERERKIAEDLFWDMMNERNDIHV